MGLNISGNVVDVDHSHNQHLNTGRHGNPVVQQVPAKQPELTVYSTFQRHKAPQSKSRDRNNRKVGDNCHLLYALKGKDGLTTTFGAMRRLLLNFDSIIEDMLDQVDRYDVVIPMPSEHNISRIYADRLARRFNCEVKFNVFDKISAEQALELLHVSPLSSSEKSRVKARLDPSKFSLKNVPIDFRQHFPPIAIGPGGIPLEFTRFLLADDLLATGTTLVAAKRLIQTVIPGAIVDAACLFSAV
jgi:hypothetical protein